MSRPGRNAPCPCGSGKKYKKCCLERDLQRAESGSGDDRGPAAALDWLRTYHRHAHEQAVSDYLEPILDENGRMSSALEAYSEMISMNLGEWLLTEAQFTTTKGEHRAIELLTDRGPRLTPRQRAWLKAIAAAPLLLYEVVEVRRDEGLVVRDTLDADAEEFFVQERAATHNSVPGMYFGARVVHWDGHDEFSGALYPFTNTEGLQLAALMERTLGSETHTEAPGRHRVANLIRVAWLQGITTPQTPPKITDAASGGAMMLTTDHFTVRDRDRLIASLENEPDVEGDAKSGWARLEGPVSEEVPQRIRCSITLSKRPNRVEVFTRTLAAADEAREWFGGIAGDSVRHLTRELSDPAHLFKDASRSKPPGVPAPTMGGDDFTPEERTELMQQVLEQLYHDWADKPIPALEGKSPRQALRTKTGKAQVLRLIRSYVANEKRQAEAEGRVPADLGFLLRELGL